MPSSEDLTAFLWSDGGPGVVETVGQLSEGNELYCGYRLGVGLVPSIGDAALRIAAANSWEEARV
jgi:hypothetical protein|tara:strand:- start:509 stop:703 length:195 start_codon:yes stop_codon:yes gene_type:complete